MGNAERVDLAFEPDFRLGNVTVRPSRRELVRDDGAREVLEHRVMQVLVALAKAQGAIVTRDQLILCCWDGRVVGDDAVNRVLSRLRKSARGIANGSFGIETVTRIGYRLTDPAAARDDGFALTGPEGTAKASKPTRRGLMTGAAALGLAVVGIGGAWLYRRRLEDPLPAEVATLMTQGALALEQTSSDSHNDAIGAFQRVVEIAPYYAEGWGMLGYAYAFLCHFQEPVAGNAMRARAVSAGRRSLELDPGNASGELALATAQPFIGRWLECERGLRRALADEPGNDHALRILGARLMFAGRSAEAVSAFRRIRRKPLTASVYAEYMEALWHAHRIEEADRAMREAATLYPTNMMVWLTRLDLLRFGGRPAAAIAMLQDPRGWPRGMSEIGIEKVLAVTRAIESRDRALVQAVIDDQFRAPRLKAGHAGEAILFANAVNRVDEAFAFAEAYYFGRGPGALDEQLQLALNERHTRYLFDPASAPMRKDPRFARLAEEIGLERYWHDAGVQPDYRRA